MRQVSDEIYRIIIAHRYLYSVLISLFRRFKQNITLL